MPVCAIVGAGEGLGSALATKFAKENFDIALLSRTEAGSSAAFKAALEVAGDQSTAHCFQADAHNPESIERALSHVATTIGPIEVLIYNVRDQFTRCEPLDMSYDALEEQFRLEVIGALAAAKSVVPAMRREGFGSVFFSSATAAFRGSENYPYYAIGKFGLRALSQSLSKAYARDGVHFVHVRLDCDLDVPMMRELYGDQHDQSNLANPHDVAQSYWLTHLQPRSAWSNEIELRPHTEVWTY